MATCWLSGGYRCDTALSRATLCEYGWHVPHGPPSSATPEGHCPNYNFFRALFDVTYLFLKVTYWLNFNIKKSTRWPNYLAWKIPQKWSKLETTNKWVDRVNSLITFFFTAIFDVTYLFLITSISISIRLECTCCAGTFLPLNKVADAHA